MYRWFPNLAKASQASGTRACWRGFKRGLPPMPSTSDLLRVYGLKAKQQLSQNFILDLRVTDRLVAALGDVSDCAVIEVGPGPGSLTRSIIAANPREIAVVEKDTRFLPALELLKDACACPLKIVAGDVLNVDLADLVNADDAVPWDSDEPARAAIIGNLPYSISTPLLIKLVRDVASQTGAFRLGRVKMLLTFQHEVAERIRAPINCADRGRLSPIVQNYFHVRKAARLPPQVFVPPPKVLSQAVLFEPRLVPLYGGRDTTKLDMFEKVLRAGFRSRRKYIVNNLAGLWGTGRENAGRMDLARAVCAEADVLLTSRAETLSVVQWGRLTDAYLEQHSCSTHPS